jgi:NADP-dependent 3-hydroxy acid dehydrogenase YdfG
MTKHTRHSKPTDAPVWFITGCSTGFGLELTRQAIERCYRTVVTARDLAKVDELRRDFAAGEAVARGADFSRVAA